MQRRIKRMKVELRLKQKEEERGGQRKIDEMVEGRRIKLSRGKERGRDGRGDRERVQKRQRQCSLGEVVREVGQVEKGVQVGERQEANKRGKWDRARVGSKRKERQAGGAEGDERVQSEHGSECDNSRCRSTRVKTRQSTLWGLWSSNSGGTSMDSGAEVERVEGVAASWEGPSKDRKGGG